MSASKRLVPGMAIEDIARCLGGARSVPVPVPWDCRDGFYHAFWRRPEAYLDERVRAGISVFARLDDEEKAGALARRTGAWKRRNADLLQLDELDLGYRLVVAEP
jgi:hypothetical protein